jgi:hypothetical protein
VKIDRDVANRALLDIGDEMLTDGDIAQNNLKWRVIKEYYLTTVTTALSSVPWTMGKRREPLTKEEEAVNYSPYRYRYALPVDCVRPLEIQGNHFFVIEDNYLRTDLDGAALLYITDGKRTAPLTGTVAAGHDYPDYDDVTMEPLFWDYIEKMLASKIAVKLSNLPEVSQAMFAMAMLVRQEAVEIIRATSGSPRNGERRWDEALNNYIRDMIARGQQREGQG